MPSTFEGELQYLRDADPDPLFIRGMPKAETLSKKKIFLSKYFSPGLLPKACMGVVNSCLTLEVLRVHSRFFIAEN